MPGGMSYALVHADMYTCICVCNVQGTGGPLVSKCNYPPKYLTLILFDGVC